MNRRGFTLIELLVVISIIALLSGVVMASLNSARDKARLAAGKELDANIYHAAADSAVAIWDFDECSGSAAKDRSGAASDATLGGATWSSNTPAGVGCSLSFNGANQYAQVSPGIALSSAFTVSAWFKTADGAQTAWRTILSKQTVSSSRNYWFGLSGSNTATYGGSYGNLVFLYSVGGATDVGHAYSLRRVDDNQWHFGAAVYDGTKLSLYLDGALQNVITVASPDQQTADTVIGLYSDLSTNDFNGLIDSVHLFSKSLTAVDIGGLYAAEKGRFEVANL